jgi:hypothetical protein
LHTHSDNAQADQGEFEFGGHEAHVVAAMAAEYFPGPHDWQALSSTAPAAAEYLPSTQSSQKGTPSAGVRQYFPAPHCVHVFACPEPEVKTVINPSAHFVHAVAPAAEM